VAQAFDTKRLELTGEATPVAEQIGAVGYYASFSASRDNVLVYRAGFANQARLTLYDWQGKSAGTVGDPGVYVEFALSPDGTKARCPRLELGTRISTFWTLRAERAPG
jgi:hypothetical protein